jgi:hypothetical protein
MPNSEPFTLAVCAEMVFRSLPITERVRRISNLGWRVARRRKRQGNPQPHC